MKILFISTDNYNASGAFLSMTYLILELRKLGIDAFVILPTEDEGGIALLKEYGICYEQIKSYNWIMSNNQKMSVYFRLKIFYKQIYNYLVKYKIKKIQKREKCNIIHINTMCSYVGAIVALDMNIPLVWHIREYLEEDFDVKIWNKQKGYHLIAHSDAIIPISRGIENKYQNIFPKEKVKVVYNGISPVFYNPEKRIFVEDTIKIIVVGTISENKGQLIALKAIRKYMEFNKNVLLKIIGRGQEEYVEKIKKYIFAEKMESNVEILGNTSHIRDYYQWADISLTCSRCEAFGRVTIEAMMSGCLVIGSNSGCTGELITDKLTGLLFDQGDEKSLLKKIEFVVQNQNIAKIIADNGRRMALENFTSEMNAKKIAGIYKDIL